MYNMNDKDNKFINAINTIITNFENIKFVQSNNIESLISTCKLIENDINKIKSDNRLLKIGIIGKMKAGKSSFVNALLFDGNNILPTAATPKTANLTRINFGEKDYIKVTFYNEDEWKNIEDKAYKFKSIKEEENKIQVKDDEMYNQNFINPNTPFYKELESSYEIYNMILTKNRKGILDKLGKEEILGENEASAIGEIMNAYVGEDGIYTPIVKNVEVYIKVNNDEDLKDIQIVDTPGLDDTVLSRSLVTEKFLSECHVVFVLSQSSSFLDASDMQLIIQRLPSAAVNHIFVVGSMLDFALLDYNERGNTRNLDFNKVLSITVKSLRENANEQIKNYFSDKYNVAEKLKDSLPPKFISSMFYRAGICKKNNLDYPPDVNDAINNMKEKFYNFDESYKNLFTLAGIDSIKLKCLIPIIEEKDKIIETKINEYTDVKIAQVLRELEDINIILTNNLDKIENADIRGLEEEKENIIKKLNSLRIRIQSTFDSVNTDSKKYINLIKDRIHKEMFNFEELKEDVHKYNKQEKRKTGIFGLKTEYYNITITEKTVALSEVSNNFSKYANKCYKIINDEFNKLFDIQELRRSIKGIVVDIVDKKSKNFNENDIIMPIENALKKITIPEIKIEYKKYIDEIVNVFSSSGLLKGNDVADLKFQYSRLLDSMREDIQNNLDTINKKIENNLNIISSNFVDEISKDLENNINNIIKSLGNKEKAIEEYKKYIDIVKKSKDLLNEIN